MSRQINREIVRYVLLRDTYKVGSGVRMAKTYAKLDWLKRRHLPHVEKVMDDWGKKFISNVGDASQAKLIQITKKMMGNRPDGGGRALLQFASYSFLMGAPHWPRSIRGRDKNALIHMTSFAKSQGAKLLRGHDTVAEMQDMKLAMEILAELASWGSSGLTLDALDSFFRSIDKELAAFMKTAQELSSDKKWANKKWVRNEFARICVQQVINQPVYAPDPYNTTSAFLHDSWKLIG